MMQEHPLEQLPSFFDHFPFFKLSFFWKIEHTSEFLRVYTSIVEMDKEWMIVLDQNS